MNPLTLDVLTLRRSYDSPFPLLLAGPTASGKSEVALLLAEKLGGEIISVDSMQVYRGLDLGTAKPTSEERLSIPHHLLDVIELSEKFDAAQFVELAQAAVAEIQARGRVPILCGGTGLYFKAFLDGLGNTPATDPAVRTELENTPLPNLLSELAERDPITYAQIDRKNPRRVFRALEVIRLTGKPFSSQRANWQQPPPATLHVSHFACQASCLFGLSRSPEDLRKRIDARVDAMFHRGLVAETEQLIKRGLAANRIAMQALGYRQVVEHLRGGLALPETIALVKARTRKFAKRQMTWFRRQLPLRWIQVEEGQSAAEVAENLAKDYLAGNPTSEG
jgi:tRNA dimethylallyltransferase